MKDLFSLGVRRDGSYYTRVEWASKTETDPKLWVLNVINDDLERNGGTWGANCEEKADLVLSFFGERQKVSKIRIYKNVGVTISVPEEMAKVINVYASDTDEPLKLRTAEDNIDDVKWDFVCKNEMEKEFGWCEITFEKPFYAKYLRFELVGNFCSEENFIPWIETSEIKIY